VGPPQPGLVYDQVSRGGEEGTVAIEGEDVLGDASPPVASVMAVLSGPSVANRSASMWTATSACLPVLSISSVEK
jgi:hypothetical protein